MLLIKLLCLSILSATASSSSASDNIINEGTGTNYCSTFRVKKLEDRFTGTGVTIAYRSTETTLTVRMNTTAKGYIGLGLSSSGYMEGTEAVIGREPNDVGIYKLGTYFAEILESKKQTLMNTTFIQGEDGSFLEFTKLLEDGDDVAEKKIIDGNGTNKFIWAVGRDSNLVFHQAFGALDITLSPFCSEDEVEEEVVVVERKDYKIFFAIHGILAVLAFGVFMPFAIATSRARNLFDFEFRNKKAWFVIHSGLNSLAYILTVVLVALAIYAYEKKGKTHFKIGHETVGFLTLILMTIQVVAGVFRPDAHSPTKGFEKIEKSFTSDVSSEVENGTKLVNESGDSEEESGDSQKESNQPKVRLIRNIWQKSHILMGVGTLGCGIYQLHSGAALYETLFLASNLVVALWIAIACVFAILIGMIVYSMRRK